MNEVCPSCGSFTDYLGELTGWCSECEGILGVAVSKPCACCKTWKPLDQYGPCSGKRDGLRSSCRACETGRRRQWRLDHPEAERIAQHRHYEQRKARKLVPQPSLRTAVGQYGT